IGGMIGGGIFAVIGLVLQIVGSMIYLTLLLCTFSAILTGYSYVKLSKLFPSSGASYTYIKRGLSERVGNFFGWMLWFGYTSAISLYAFSFGSYLSYVTNVDPKVYGIALIMILTLLNLMGAKETGVVENLIVSAKVIILLVFSFAGISYLMGIPQHSASMEVQYIGFNTVKDVFLGASLIFIAYEGFELIATSTEEVKNPEKNIGRAIAISISAVSVIYFLTAFVTVNLSSLVETEEVEGILAKIASFFLGDFGKYLMIVGALLSTSSALNASLFGSSRILFNLSRDGVAPRILSKTNKKRVPILSTILTSLLSTMILLLGGLEEFSVMSSFTFLLIFLTVNFTSFVLIRKGVVRGSKVVTFLSLITISLSIWLMALHLMTKVAWTIFVFLFGVALLLS
ncbi:MAG: amino acid permease, partial [Candidatus Odinarchaeota archaeon]|nr:amino acid permease [Candidatus Odinarchaeota archaeon]